MKIEIGTKAPAFTLFDTSKNKVSLEDFANKNLLILFFPLAFTGVCTKELCSIRDNIATYNNTNAAVVGISVDSVFTLEKFKQEQNINFPLLSDFNKEISAKYDVLYEIFPALEMRGVSKRAAFIVDKNQTIQYAEICATPGDLPNFSAIEAVLKNLN